jgi:sugar (pentulose or hexulose) kinase
MKMFFAGLDIGTTNIKCCIYSTLGKFVASASTPTPWKINRNEIEVDSKKLFDSVMLVLNEISNKFEGIVGAIGITGMAEAGLLLDKFNEPIVPIVSWSDHRALSVLPKLQSEINSIEFIKITGLKLNDRATISKLLWFQENQELPASLKWVGVPEWIGHKLGGRLVAERSLASRTGLYDFRKDNWDFELSKICFKNELILPELISTNESIGFFNIPSDKFYGAELIIGGHDHLCAAVGVNYLNSKNIVDSMGTGEALSRIVDINDLNDSLIIDAISNGMTIGCYPIKNNFSVMVGLGSGIILNNALKICFPDKKISQEMINDLSTSALLDESELELTFGDLTDKSSNFEFTKYKKSSIWRAALNLVSLRAKDGTALMDSMFGNHNKLIVCGGWLKNPVVRKIKLNYLGSFYLAEIEEPGCFGAAKLAATAANLEFKVENHLQYLD